MQQLTYGDAPVFLDRVIAEVIPDEDGVDALQSFPRAHATLMRQLTADLIQEVGLTLGDFDVLAQLAQAGGEL